MAYLFVLNGSARYRAIPLEGGTCTLGKGEQADIRLPDPWVSTVHAELRVKGGELEIEDLRSTNGTFLNLARVERAPLHDEDLLFLGGTHLLVVTSGRAPSAPPPHATTIEHAERAAARRLERRPDEIDVSPLPLADEGNEVLPPSREERTMTLRRGYLRGTGAGPLPSDSDEHAPLAAAAPPLRDEVREIERALLAPRPLAPPRPAAPPPVPSRGEESGPRRAAPPDRASAAAPAPSVPDSTDGDWLAGHLEIDLDALLGESAVSDLLRFGGAPLRGERHGPARRSAQPTTPTDVAFGAGWPTGNRASAAAERRVRELEMRLLERDAELDRLREQVLRLKERYLDL